MAIAVGIDWDGVYSAHADQVYRIAWLVVRDEQDAADVVQSTFERAFRARSRVDPLRPLEPWLMRIATNEALSLARRRRIRQWIPLLGHEPSPGADPDGGADDAAVWDVVAALSPAHRAVIGLHYAFGYSVDEIAEITRTPRGTVGSRLHYARERLRSLLAQRDND